MECKPGWQVSSRKGWPCHKLKAQDADIILSDWEGSKQRLLLQSADCAVQQAAGYYDDVNPSTKSKQSRTSRSSWASVVARAASRSASCSLRTSASAASHLWSQVTHSNAG